MPKIAIWREQIDGRYRSPAYGQACDDLHLSGGDVHIDEFLRLTNYKAIGQPE